MINANLLSRYKLTAIAAGKVARQRDKLRGSQIESWLNKSDYNAAEGGYKPAKMQSIIINKLIYFNKVRN